MRVCAAKILSVKSLKALISKIFCFRNATAFHAKDSLNQNLSSCEQTDTFWNATIWGGGMFDTNAYKILHEFLLSTLLVY